MGSVAPGAAGAAGGAGSAGDRLADLVDRAAQGDAAAWGAIVDRYLPLVRAVVRRYRLGAHDAEDVNQTVWLLLVQHLGSLREPRALPQWIATTTKHEALRVVRARQRVVDVDPQGSAMLDPGLSSEAEVDGDLLRVERRQALRDGLAELPPRDRDLLLLLAEDPPVAYSEISRRLGMPVGSIGPTRARCLRRLRETEAVRAYVGDPTPAGPTQAGPMLDATGGDRRALVRA